MSAITHSLQTFRQVAFIADLQMDNVLGRALMLEANTHYEGQEGPIQVLRGRVYDTVYGEGENEFKLRVQKSGGGL
jgi:hypothetical protein